MQNLRSKILRIILMITFLGALLIFTLYQKNSTTPHYDDLVRREEKIQKLISKGTEDDSLRSVEIYLNGEKLLYEEETNTLYYSLNLSDEAYTNPEVVLKEAADAEGTDEAWETAGHQEHMQIFFAENPFNMSSVSENRKTDVYLCRGDSYTAMSLVCTTLPIVTIDMDCEQVEKELEDTGLVLVQDTLMEMEVYDCDAEEDGCEPLTVSYGTFRRRGGTTIAYEQCGFRIHLLDEYDPESGKNKENLLGMRSDDDWILNTTATDNEKVRNVFSTNLWYLTDAGENEWKAENAVRYRYVELFLNGSYWGLYALGYPVDAKVLDIAEDEDGQQTEYTLKKKNWEGSEYLSELVDMSEDGSGEYGLPGYECKQGELETANARIHELYKLLVFSQEKEKLTASVDINNVIDFWLTIKLTAGRDNLMNYAMKNFYVTAKQSDTGNEGYKLLFTPWDLDETWGNVYDATYGVSQYGWPADYDTIIYWLPMMALNKTDLDLVSMIQERYAELRADAWSEESLTAMADEYEKDIYDSGAFARNMEKFPNGRYNDPAEKLSAFRAYIAERLQCMDRVIDSLDAEDLGLLQEE